MAYLSMKKAEEMLLENLFLKDAKKHNIIVNTVQAGDMSETTPIWKEIAQYGGGRYMAIPQSGGDVVVIISPYDDEILELQGELDRTVVPYGGIEQKAEISRKMSERSASAPATRIDNSGFYAKRSKKKEIVTGGGDLLGDVRNNEIDLSSISKADLPDELQDKPVEARKAWVTEKLEARTILETRMTELTNKRDAFVLEQRKKTKTATTGDSFDAAVEDTLKVQLE